MGEVAGAGGTKGTISIQIIIKQDYNKFSSTGISTDLWTLEDRYY